MTVRGRTRKDGIPSKGETKRGLFKSGSGAEKKHVSLVKYAKGTANSKSKVGGTVTLVR